MRHKICGTLKTPALKILPLQDATVKQENGLVYIEGYANTKNLADRYGDIPTVLKQKRNFVYELTEFKKNPVLLIDHVNQLDHLAGSVTEIFEDEKGLYFKALFSASNHPTIAHARQLYKEGHAKGISIAGRFHYEVPSDPSLLTLAEIYEISLVAIPADPRSLAAPVKDNDDEEEEQRKKQEKSNRQKLEKEINAWLKELRK